MTWTPDEWDIFCGLVQGGFPKDFEDSERSAWRVFLDEVDPQLATAGLKRIVLAGTFTYRPSVSEFMGAIRFDPTVPTFDEALHAIRHALKANGPSADEITRKTGSTFIDADTEKREKRAAIQARLAEAHPLVGTFVQRQGLARLKNLPLDDADWGEKTRRDLEAAWDEHVNTEDHRKVATLVERSGRGEPAKLNPAAALGITSGDNDDDSGGDDDDGE